MEFNHMNYGYCNMSGKLFVLANQRGYDSQSFIEKLMYSQVGEHLYHSPYTDLWIGETYIMAVFVLGGIFVQGLEPDLPGRDAKGDADAGTGGYFASDVPGASCALL